jgi:hypothetical protein
MCSVFAYRPKEVRGSDKYAFYENKWAEVARGSGMP